ncbi:unnamed protein product [Polarella glacialis]|uniref:Uncharacterized protein n=1 Tax=Polarella glacialis TaxID=89957 RepID=A0A813GQQ0_POLGL|nr:unnamed protein product [Polarella glacialis]
MVFGFVVVFLFLNKNDNSTPYAIARCACCNSPRVQVPPRHQAIPMAAVCSHSNNTNSNNNNTNNNTNNTNTNTNNNNTNSTNTNTNTNNTNNTNSTNNTNNNNNTNNTNNSTRGCAAASAPQPPQAALRLVCPNHVIQIADHSKKQQNEKQITTNCDLDKQTVIWTKQIKSKSPQTVIWNPLRLRGRHGYRLRAPHHWSCLFFVFFKNNCFFQSCFVVFCCHVCCFL